jgi:hypothetical protein
MTGEIQNLDAWRLPPSVDLALVDGAYAEKLRAECSSTDHEADGCRADKILGELLRKLGMTRTADAYENLDLWRA